MRRRFFTGSLTTTLSRAGRGQLVWRVARRLKPIASAEVWVGGARVTLNEKVWLDRASTTACMSRRS